MKDSVPYGEWLRRRRRSLDLTQSALADRVGCSLAMMQKIEHEERRPSRQLAELLARALQIPADQHDTFIKSARGDRLVPEWLAPAPAIDARPALPKALTPLIGRESELSSIGHILDDPHCKLLTLIGPGGIGKTRLALQAANLREAEYADGAAFVGLASISDHEQIVTAIADALGFVLYGATDRAVQLFHYLREKSLLLVLDNFEHLLSDASCVALVNALLEAAPHSKLLTTSRAPLQLQAEWVFAVQGLPVPRAAEDSDLEANGAVRLFMHRARQSQAGIALSKDDLAAVLQICSLVEGLPLAIELAAAWVRTLNCQEIAREIQRNVDFLAASSRDVPDRHRSLRTVFEYSWNLLPADEQRALRQLAIFGGGFTRAGAEAVAGASLALLSSLVSKSLLRRSEGERYALHEVVRQYALVYLQRDSTEYAAAEARHGKFFAGLLEERGPALKGVEREAVVADLLPDLANLRQAWQWAATQQQAEELSRSADTLFWLYESRCNCREGVPLFGQAASSLQQAAGAPVSEAAHDTQRLALSQTLTYQGFFLFRQGQAASGRDLLSRSEQLLAPLAQDASPAARAALSNAHAFLGTVEFEMGDYGAGLRLLHESLAQKRALGDRWGTAFCLRQLGLANYRVGDYAAAYRLATESLTLGRAMGNTWAIAASLNLLGTIALAQGAHAEAQALLREGLALSNSIEDRFNAAQALHRLGLIAHALGQDAEALDLIRKSVTLSDEIGDLTSLAQALNSLGRVRAEMGDPAAARRCYQDGLRAALEAEVMPTAIGSLLGLAALLIQTGRGEPALELLCLITKHPASALETIEHAARLRAVLEAELTSEQVEAAQVRAGRATLESAAQQLLEFPTRSRSLLRYLPGETPANY